MRSPNTSLDGRQNYGTKSTSDAVSGRSKHDFLDSIRSKLILKYGSDQISKRAIDQCMTKLNTKEKTKITVSYKFYFPIILIFYLLI